MTTEMRIATATDRALTNGDLLRQAGQAANRVAARHTFEEYRSRKAANTIRRQDADLALFAKYLLDVPGIETGDLAHDTQAWAGVTWGLVETFVKWMLDEGYATGSVNVRLSSVKTYAKLAAKAETLERSEYAMIRTVEGYRRKEAVNIDAGRSANGGAIRRGHKKAEPVTLTREQAQLLKEKHSDDGQGRRDHLLVCLLLDHGLRCGEVAGLTVGNLDLGDNGGFLGYLTFYRAKVDMTQTIQLTPATLAAARTYLQGSGAPAEGRLLLGSTRAGHLTTKAMSTRAINKRIGTLGRRIGVERLGPHDLRHTWATLAARAGTPLERLQQAGGWASVAMPLRYIEQAKIANAGVLLE